MLPCNKHFKTSNMKFLLLAATLFLAACTTTPKKGAEIFQRDGAAIGGYDPVAFFTESKPVKGTTAYNLKWKEANWQFASQQNLDSFKASPKNTHRNTAAIALMALQRDIKHRLKRIPGRCWMVNCTSTTIKT
jgi:hypothetical protein